MDLRHREVLVVARVRDQRLVAALHPRQVEPVEVPQVAHAGGGAGAQPHAVRLVAPDAVGVAGAEAVQGVQVESRRAALHELLDGDLLTEEPVGPVHGEVVVDELAEVGVAGGDLGVRLPGLAGRDHGRGDPPGQRRVHGAAGRRGAVLGHETGEAEVPQLLPRRGPPAACPRVRLVDALVGEVVLGALVTVHVRSAPSEGRGRERLTRTRANGCHLDTGGQDGRVVSAPMQTNPAATA